MWAHGKKNKGKNAGVNDGIAKKCVAYIHSTSKGVYKRLCNIKQSYLNFSYYVHNTMKQVKFFWEKYKKSAINLTAFYAIVQNSIN